MSYLLTFIVLVMSASRMYAQPDTARSYKVLQGRLHYGFIFAHSVAVHNTAGSHPVGLELEVIKQRVDTSVWDLCNCYPLKGFTFSYFNFDNSILGHGLSSAYFLEPAYRIGAKGQFRFRASAGLIYLTNPYHVQRNPTNMSYSTAISGFLQLAVSGNYRIAPKWLIQLGTQYQHTSNGGLKEPNKGINWPTASLGFVFLPHEYHLPAYRRRNVKDNLNRKPYLTASLFFSAKQSYKPGGESPRTPLAGLLLHGEKRVGLISALNTGVEGYYDNSLRDKLRFDSTEGSAWRIGLLAGHSFLLGRVSFTQQLGVYLYHRSPYYDQLYHRWTVYYHLKAPWAIGLGLKAHRHIADFLDVRASFRF